MDIRILDSHLREFLDTKATPVDIGREVSLRSASVEKVEPLGDDTAYELEITTNRVDMMSIQGIAKETAAALTGAGIEATYHAPKLKKLQTVTQTKHLKVVIDPKLIRRVCALEMNVSMKETPDFMKKRLEEANMRSLNVLIDITNYIMLEVGHPTHAFDMDRLNTKTMTVRESQKGEIITTLDNKSHTLSGGDIIIEDENGRIVDLVGIMGLENSVITKDTQRILFFIDNNEPWHIRKSSMGLAIRTDAAAINEKDVDPELAMTALQRGIELYEKYADAKIIEEPIDIYPHPIQAKPVEVSFERINALIGVQVDEKKAVACLKLLGFDVEKTKTGLMVTPPTSRAEDITMDADVIEEIARMIGYHTLPNDLPPFTHTQPYNQGTNTFFWESRIKHTLKYWGFIEVYTYSFVSKDMIKGDNYYRLANPLDADHVYLRQELAPSLREVAQENKENGDIAIFEMANIYPYTKDDLPHETLHLGLVLQGKNADFRHIKGTIEALSKDLGIYLSWSDVKHDGNVLVIDITAHKDIIGTIKIYQQNITAELNLEMLIQHATLVRNYTEVSKYPTVEEDITVVTDDQVSTQDLTDTIKKQSKLIIDVIMTDRYQDSRTFHIIYQSMERNLTTEDIAPIREKITKTLEKDFTGRIK